MGFLDKILRKPDREYQEGTESAVGSMARGAMGVDWPLPSDPSPGAIDILHALAHPRFPHRFRSESQDGHGYELRTHEVMALYDDGNAEWKARNTQKEVLWVEALYRPCFDQNDLDLLVVATDDDRRYWRTYDHEFGGAPRVTVTDPATGQQSLLVWLDPVVLRFRGAFISDADDVRQLRLPSFDLAGEVLAGVDRAAIARWKEAVLPHRERIYPSKVSKGVLGGALQGALNAVLREREGTTDPRIGTDGRLREDRGNDEADGGGLLGRILGGAVDGAEKGGGAAAVRGFQQGGAAKAFDAVLKAGARFNRPKDPGRDRTLPTMVECDRSPRPELQVEPWAAVTDDEVAAAVGAATGQQARLKYHDATKDWDLRVFQVGNGTAHVALVAGSLKECQREVGGAKTVGEWTMGDDTDPQIKGAVVCVGAVGDGVLMARLMAVGNPMTAMKVAKAVAAVLTD